MSGEGYSNSKPAEEIITAPELRTDGPTIEKYVRAGYPAVTYPPTGWAEKPSPALDLFRAWQADPNDAKKHAEAAAALRVSVGELVHGAAVITPAEEADVTPVDTTSPAADNQAVSTNESTLSPGDQLPDDGRPLDK